MHILDEWQTFIHTHFQTDGEQLPSERVREIEQVLLPTFRRLGIVYGFHLERGPTDPGIRVVVECRPGKRELEIIRQTLADTLRPIPRRPRPTLVRFASQESSSSDDNHSFRGESVVEAAPGWPPGKGKRPGE